MVNLGRKQSIRDQHDWQRAVAAARDKVTDAELDQLIDTTVTAVKARAASCRVAYGWSGGKDSQGLRHIMELSGVDTAVLGMTAGLEWPAMLRWQTDHMPLACDVIAVPLDLEWLRDHPEMLFPQGRYGPAWFAKVQHKAQNQYIAREAVDLFALGRRRVEGNFVGRNGENEYTDRHGVTRWSPLADWTHEHLFALISREKIPMPPCYDWPRGYQVGTGPWPARQFTNSPDEGFEECWQIDPDVIRAAAAVLPQAADWMTRTGRN